MGIFGTKRAAEARRRYVFAWHCPSPPSELEAQAQALDYYGIVDYIEDQAEEISPDTFAALVGGWLYVLNYIWGGYVDEGSLEATVDFIRNDWSITWNRSRYPDGTPIVYHTASGIEHVYEPA